MPDTAAEAPRRRTADSRVLALAAYITATVAILVRMFLLPGESWDFENFLQPWYWHIVSHGGFHALADPSFSDYNVPYLYLMAALTYLPLSSLVAIKWISVLFDLALAYYTFRTVSLFRPTRRWAALGAGAVVLFLPTVVTNSAWWGQCDATYAAFLVGGISYVLRHRPWWACTFFGLALAFKFQAVFLFPFLLVLVAAGRVPWRSLLAVPAVYLALDVPALLIGADPGQLLSVYARQTDTYHFLTINAPSVYQFVSVPGDTDPVRSVGVLVAGVLVTLLMGLACRAPAFACRNSRTPRSCCWPPAPPSRCRSCCLPCTSGTSTPRTCSP
jgi:Gpi18-like mannosyltransferase